MRQSQLDRAIARRTGEHVSTIRRMGFSMLNVPIDDVEPPASSRAEPNPPPPTYFPPRGKAQIAA